MKFVLYITVCCFLLFSSLETRAQGENNNWCFGANSGLNFNTNPPTAYTTNMSVLESSAAVSDEIGQLLFYSSGAYIWDRNGNLMPNGQNLSGNGPYLPIPGFPLNVGSSWGGVCIIKSVSNPNQYYLIVTDAAEDPIYKAYYSVIDMTLNGGLGDVVPNQRNIVLATDVAEGVKGTIGADCNSFWILLRRYSNTDVLAFKIDASGINTTPVISSTGMLSSIGIMKFNKADTRTAAGLSGDIQFYDFNKTSGLLSPSFSLQTSLSFMFGLEFSPDDSKFYTAGTSGLLQFDLSSYPNITAIQNSETVIANTNLSGIRLGPDGKMYSANIYLTSLNCINAPNASGTLCQYVTDAISLSGPSFCYIELGNPALVNHASDSVILNRKDTICKEGFVTLTPSQNCPSYSWSTGAFASDITVTTPGKYWVKGIKDCTLYIDTINVVALDLSNILGPDTTICLGASILLNPNIGNAIYTWQDGSTNATFTATAGGTYSVSIQRANCIGKDSIYISTIDPSLYIVGPDSVICKGRPFSLHAIANPESSFFWDNGSTTDSTIITGDGVYGVKAINVCGTFYDSVRIEAIGCSCRAFMPDAFTPNGDGLNDVLTARLSCPGMTNFSLRIYNRYGQQIFQSVHITAGWDGTYNGKPVDVGTYFYYLQYKSDTGEVISKKGDVVMLR